MGMGDNAKLGVGELIVNSIYPPISAKSRSPAHGAMHNYVRTGTAGSGQATVPSNALHPVQMIWMPMQNRMKADSRISTSVPREPSRATMRPAKR